MVIKTVRWIAGLLCTVVLTFVFYAMLKFITREKEGPEEGAALVRRMKGSETRLKKLI